MPIALPYTVYRDQLTALSHGLALWNPRPPKKVYNNVSIGDVGYMYEGTFIRMFNVIRPWDDESNGVLGKPDTYEPLNFDHLDVRHETFDTVDYCSPSVSREENANSVPADSPES